MLDRNSSWSSIYILAITGIVILVIATISAWIIPYEQLIDHVISATGKPHLKTALEEQYFTAYKLVWLKFLLPLFSFTGLVFIFLFREKWKQIHVFRPLLQDLLKVLSNLLPKRYSTEWWAFLMIYIYILAKAIYYLISSDIQYDEAWSYNYYTSGPWYITPFIYSNYPLYEWMTHLFKWLPFPMHINLRLPAFLTGIVWLIAVYSCASTLWNKRIALFTLALAGSLPPVSLYMLNAKGFLMVALFTLTLFTVLHLVSSGGWTEKRRRWFIISIVFGLWSSPIFILPLVITAITFLVWGIGTIKKVDAVFFKLMVAGILLSLLIYLPVIAGSGIKPLFQADILQTQEPANHTMWWHIKFISLWVSGWSMGWILTLLLSTISILLIIIRKDGFLGIFTFLSILSILLVPIIAGSYLFPRIWIFLVVPYVLTVAAAIQSIANHKLTIITLCLMILMINTYLFAHYVERTWSKAWDHSASSISKRMLDNNVKSYYTNFDYILPIAEFYSKQQDKSLQAVSNNAKSLQFGDTSKMMNVDAIVKLREKPLRIPSYFSQSYSDSIAIVYIKE